MSAKERSARVLIVDDQREQARALKMSLELLEDNIEVVEVPSGEEAMLEVGRVAFDLLVADYNLPGITGIELIRRLRKRHPELKAIIVTGSPPDKIKKELGDLEVSQVLYKPLDVSIFVGAVHEALFGPAAVEQEIVGKETEPAAESRLGPVPTIDEEPIERTLSQVLIDLGAIGLAFVSRAGEVLINKGHFDQALKFDQVVRLLAHNFTRSAEIANLMGNKPSGAVHYYAGQEYDIYALAVGLHFFLTIVFPGDSPRRMGDVLRLWRKEVQEMIRAIGPAALTIAAGAGQPAPAGAAAKDKAEVAPEVAPAAAPAAEVVTEKPTKEAPVTVQEPEAAPDLELDLDLDDLDLGEVGDLNSFWEEAAEEVEDEQAGTLSLKDALKQGLIDDLDVRT